MIYVIANSNTRITGAGQSYTQILGATRINQCKKHIITAICIEYGTRNLVLDKKDTIVFNFGGNDCIYRKNKDKQIKVITDILEYHSDNDIIKKRATQFREKDNNEIIQILSYPQFRYYTNEIFKRFPNQGIVLSVNGFPKTNKKFGWAYNEIIETNKILKECAEKYDMEYVDLFSEGNRPSLLMDAVHLTPDGHRFVADRINKAIETQI